MRSFEIIVSPDPRAVAPYDDAAAQPLPSSTDGARPARSERRERRRHAREVLDVFIAGANVTARVADAHAPCVLRDLGLAIAELATRPRGKSIVRFYDDPWEMSVERFGASAALSVYRAGADPYVVVYDRVVAWAEVVESTREALDALLARQPSGGRAARVLEVELAAAAQALREAPAEDADEAIDPPAASPVAIEIDRDAPIAFAAEFALRPGPAEAADPSVERADLHALLFRGRLRAEIRGRAMELADGHPFLFAERLLDVARRALDAWERGLPYHVRVESGGGVVVGVRVSSDGQLALTLGTSRERGAPRGESRALYTFPALGVSDVLEAAISFGRALVRAVLRRDRTQCTNLRLSAFRRQLREASDALREACQSDEKINPTPESYRAFARAGGLKIAEPRANDSGARLRYAVRWRALVPGIDLRATFLCGDRLVVGAARETFCLERTTGEVLWRVETDRATSVVTPGGIARLSPDGTLRVHDFGNGEVTLVARTAPRVGPVAGAVVHGPGLPRLLIVTEGESHLCAIDLTSGDARWRVAWQKPDVRARREAAGQRAAGVRLKRCGKLLYYTSGDSALAALDVLSGALVWRVRDRLRFRSPPTFDHDALFAVAGGVHCLAQLHALDPFSGKVRWTAVIPDPPSPCSVDGSPLASQRTIAVAVRERSSLRLRAFDRETGAPRWTSKAPVAPVGTSWLAVDDLFIGNTPLGEIVAIEAATGELRYRRVLGPRLLEADVPRRLEPVLRSGALFVPHADVHVLRPSDGAPLATIAPCEAIPDLLRVDEKCDVYVAEESGHLVSFGALARLTLVRPVKA